MTYIPLTAKAAFELAIERGGWKLPYFQFVDDFRREGDKGGLVAESPRDNERWLALLKAIVNELCYDAELDLPGWSEEIHWLSKPWFVSECENLKAISIADSPLFFRRNNIFVTRNFLSRC